MPTLVTELVRAPIAFQAAHGTTVHSPLIEADVNGAQALFVLDTDSDVHLLTPETAERAGLALEPGEEGTDHAGRSMPSWFPDTAVMLSTGGRGTEFDETVVPGLAAGEHEGLGSGVSGADVLGTRAGDQVLLVGSSRIAVASLAVRRDIGHPAGLVDTHVLRGTVLALDADPGGVVTWQLGGLA